MVDYVDSIRFYNCVSNLTKKSLSVCLGKGIQIITVYIGFCNLLFMITYVICRQMSY